METDANRYEGWSNYETWCVSLWINNEQASYEYWRGEAQRHREEAPICDMVKDDLWSVEEAPIYKLADQLNQEINDAAPIEDASLYTDLLLASLGQVNWHEIAESLLEDDG